MTYFRKRLLGTAFYKPEKSGSVPECPSGCLKICLSINYQINWKTSVCFVVEMRNILCGRRIPLSRFQCLYFNVFFFFWRVFLLGKMTVKLHHLDLHCPANALHLGNSIFWLGYGFFDALGSNNSNCMFEPHFVKCQWNRFRTDAVSSPCSLAFSSLPLGTAGFSCKSKQIHLHQVASLSCP